MTNVELADRLVELVHSPSIALSIVAELSDEELLAVSSRLKARSLFYLRREAPKALAIAELIQLIGLERQLPVFHALGLQTEAIVLTLSQREFEEALALYAAAEKIFLRHDEHLEIARGQVSQIWALACLQRYEEAFDMGEETAVELARNDEFSSLAALSNNLAAIYGRRGQDTKALEQFREVEQAYIRLGPDGRLRRPLALINQAIVLRNLGRFEESIYANEAALNLAMEQEQKAIIARAEQNLGMTYFLLGRINEAQILLQKARDSFIGDHRYRDAILAELFVSDGLLHLRRYEDVLEICQRVKETFREAGTQFEVAQALLNEATALAGLNADEGALVALDDARRIFDHEQNAAWRVYTDLEEASILYHRQKYKESANLAARSVDALHSLDLPLKEVQALLITAQATLALSRHEKTALLLEKAKETMRTMDIPVLSYRAHYLQGQLAQRFNDSEQALAAYDAAIHELERLQGRIMVEFRADFLADKDEVYSQAVDLCLRSDDPERALGYAERAKSRALLSMLSHHADLRIEAKSADDQALVDRILHLRERRDRLYRRWEMGETQGSTVNWEEEQESGQAVHQEALNVILETEDEIRTLWHSLLVRNAAYIRDASLWQVQTKLDQSALDSDTLLVEFFTLPDGLVVFLVSTTEIQAVRLPLSMSTIAQLQMKLDHNFGTLKERPHLADRLISRAQRNLQEIYQLLVAPWIDYARRFTRLTIVPHGPLHYLPLHALFDGHEYLLQQFQISYLPGSSFLQKGESSSTAEGTLVMGHTHDGRLKNVPAEVTMIGAALNTRPYLNEESTRNRFQEEAPKCRLIHMAAHGDFKAGNPLFSGLYLNDGLLTTLDIFNMRLPASLVTLSACQTGRSLVGGGDELFGLTRAFLTAGTESLILTLWPVEDRSTTHLMNKFYDGLLNGKTKIAALQIAQESLMSGSSQKQMIHPYYWAPFFLMGDTGTI